MKPVKTCSFNLFPFHLPWSGQKLKRKSVLNNVETV